MPLVHLEEQVAMEPSWLLVVLLVAQLPVLPQLMEEAVVVVRELTLAAQEVLVFLVVQRVQLEHLVLLAEVPVMVLVVEEGAALLQRVRQQV